MATIAAMTIPSLVGRGLTDDALAMIFEVLCLESRGEELLPTHCMLVVARVCRRWRTIALGNAKLWASFEILIPHAEEDDEFQDSETDHGDIGDLFADTDHGDVGDFSDSAVESVLCRRTTLGTGSGSSTAGSGSTARAASS